MNLIPIFITVFLAELGDKTQLATLLFASGKEYNPLGVFLASAGALILSSALAVLLGATIGHAMERLPLKLYAGIGFIIIGLWTLREHFTAH